MIEVLVLEKKNDIDYENVLFVWVNCLEILKRNNPDSKIYAILIKN